jgi:ankyrin repeat protein
MNDEVMSIDAWLIASTIFVIWQIRINPIGQIHNAVLDGNLEQVRKYLKKGVDPNLLKSGWQSPLSLAVNNDRQEIAELLISYGADINPKSKNSPLCEAASNGHKEMVELLVEKGADINHGLEDDNRANPLLEAAVNRYPEIVQLLLDKNAIIGLHFAAFQGDIKSVELFLAQQSCSIDSQRLWLSKNVLLTPLHLAAIAGHENIVELLLDNEADIEGVNIDPSETSTPLLQAVSNNHPKIVEILIDRGADINRAAAMYLSTYQNNTEMLNLLIKKGGDVNHHNSGDTPLHIASQKGYVEIAKILLSNDAEVNSQSSSNGFEFKTPLHFASEGCHLEMAKLLIEHGAEVNNGALSIFSPIPVTPLDYARNHGCTEIIDLLKQHGGIEYGFLD